MKIARWIFNALTVISIIATIICLIVERNILLMIFLMLAIVFLSISDKIGQKQSLNELKKRYNEENLKVELNESTNPIWDEVRKHGNCYMKIQGDIAIIKFVIGEKEIEIPPIQLTDIEKYINTD